MKAPRRGAIQVPKQIGGEKEKKMKNNTKNSAWKSTIAVLFAAIMIASVLTVIAPSVIAEERAGQELPPGGSPTAAQLAAAILTPSTAPLLVSASKTGAAAQFENYTTSIQGFPTDGSSFAVISTGKASSISPGPCTVFYSFSTNGPSAAGWSCRGQTCYDIATLKLSLFIPPGATNLSFDWLFGTEENPTYTSTFRDTAKAIVTTSTGSTNILLLPDGKCCDVFNAAPFSNVVTGSSVNPVGCPVPNDMVYNAVTGQRLLPLGIYTTTFNVAPYVGENITIELQIGDENDRILDSALFIDNLNINQAPNVTAAHPSMDCLWPPNHKFVDITIEGVTDPDNDPVTITITNITSDEPTASIEGAGGAEHAPDAYGVGTDTASLRAERSGTGNGRVYEIAFVASDGKGGETEGNVTVCVPHDRRKGTCDCIDDGQNYDATEIN